MKMGHEWVLDKVFQSDLFLFSNTKKNLDTCQNMEHKIYPTVDIKAKLCNFSLSKVMESGSIYFSLELASFALLSSPLYKY